MGQEVVKKEVGRPTVFTEITLQKLEEAFMKGLSDRQACIYANIAESSLYAYCKEYSDFSERKEKLKDAVKLRARLNVEEQIQKKDINTSKWYLERKDSEFADKSENKNLNVNISLTDLFEKSKDGSQ